MDLQITTISQSEVDAFTPETLAYQIADLLGKIADAIGRQSTVPGAQDLCQRLANDSELRISTIETFYAQLDDEKDK